MVESTNLAPQIQCRSRSTASGHSHHGHSHTAGDGDETAALLSALQGSADRGSRITLIGLASNVGLVAAKGVAGWALNSAALMADAGHSLSDLVGDFVVLLAWKLSRRPPSPNFPHGYGKFESLGSLVVAALLALGGLGIGLHSFHLLQTTLGYGTPSDVTSHHDHFNHSLPHSPLPSFGGHAHDLVDPKAAWFALGGVLVKEWLYRITMEVAKEEKSNVLVASALHHRSDALSSIVALAAIAFSTFGFVVADPLGGLFVTAMILFQAYHVGLGALQELLDRDPEPELSTEMRKVVLSLMDEPAPTISAVSELKLSRSGPNKLVQVDVTVRPEVSVAQTTSIEKEVLTRLRDRFEDVTEVRVRFRST